MKTFTINTGTSCITLQPAAPDAEAAEGAEHFATAAAFAELASRWPPARLVAIWNALPGETRVKKFQNRATAVSRIWKAIQKLAEAAPAEIAGQPDEVPAALTAGEHGPDPEAAPTPGVAPQTPAVTPEAEPAKTRATRVKKPPAAAVEKRAGESNKTETITGLLRRPGGASLPELMQVTGWQAHSVRGFISGTLRKKMNLTVISSRAFDQERNYSIEV